MTDEAGPDVKVLAVPITKLDPEYENIQAPADLPKVLLDQISHFFQHYKELESGKWVKVEEWTDAEDAKTEILTSVKRYKRKKSK